MFVTRMTTGSEVIESPTWHDVEAAIRRLDGDEDSLVMLGVDDEYPHMGIGGGKEHRYVAYVTFDNEEFRNMESLGAAGASIEMVVGGQLVSYKPQACVGLDVVLDAARTFYEEGELGSNATWG